MHLAERLMKKRQRRPASTHSLQTPYRSFTITSRIAMKTAAMNLRFPGAMR